MPYPGAGFPIPPFSWPHVGRQWPAYNVESDQAEGLMMWMPYGGGYPGLHQHVDRIRGLVFTEGGTPVWVSDDQRGWSLLFDDANNEYLIAASTPVISPPLTMTLRFLSDTIAQSQTLIWIGQTTPGTNYWQLVAAGGVGGDPIRFRTVGVGGAANADTPGGYSANVWQHAAAVEKATDDHQVYLDGLLKGVSGVETGIPAGPDAVAVGFSGTSSTNYVSGRIMDVRIYNVAKTDAQVYEIATNPRELHRPPPRLWMLAPVGGIVYYQAAAGILTPAGAIAKMTTTLRAGTLTMVGALARRTGKPLAGMLTTAGTLVKKAQKALAGTLITAGALARRTGKSLAGTLTPTGAIVATKMAFKSLAGTLTTAGVLIRKTSKPLAGTLTAAGAITRKVSKSFAGTLILTGTAAKGMFVSLAGTLTTAGALVVKAVTVVPIALTLWTRSVALTLKDRSQALTLWARNLGLTLRNRE